jgi:hypothetical protein
MPLERGWETQLHESSTTRDNSHQGYFPQAVQGSVQGFGVYASKAAQVAKFRQKGNAFGDWVVVYTRFDLLIRRLGILLAGIEFPELG